MQESLFPNVLNYHFISWKEANKHILSSDCFNFDSPNVRNILLNDEKNNLIISSEFFSTAINSGFNYGYFSYGISHKLKLVFPEAKVLIFIRRQQSLIASAYQQYVKNGGTFGFRRWLYSGEVFWFEHLLYDNLISHYKKLFGDDSVYVYLYENLKEDISAFTKKFCEEHNLEINWEKINFNPINRGLRRITMPLLKIINHFYKKPLGRKRYICHIPGMTLIGKGVVKYLNPMPIFGRYLREDDFLKPKDLEYIKNFYSQHNQNLTKYVSRDDLEKFGYFL
ncbi:hypothetical protein [Tenuifilum thalassicum]|uniref:Sulfotransferase n=1 Tax=Tenuifilum thalassicum TaxID=2590900 RepID=A0A7D3Y5V4_9BACT|nr:hypothetical protein [Tenuifilum thalassicum]QKG80909.1 hypothetical protein FHG85_11760 [Tenuifilum thalassicum]